MVVIAMGKRGFPPKPTKLKVLHGERHQDRLNNDEPEPMGTSLDVPEDASPAVAAVWVRVAAELAGMGLSYSADADSFRCYCEAVVNHRAASAELARSDVLVRGERGNWVPNPAFRVQRDSAQLVRTFAHEFGLTPSARSTIRTAEAGFKAASAGGDSNPYADTG